jgi:hypothetical protein
MGGQVEKVQGVSNQSDQMMMGENCSAAFARIRDGFGPVQRVLLGLGFVLFCIGLLNGFEFYNRTLMIGVSLLSAGFAVHYLSTAMPVGVPVDEEKSEINWISVLLALIVSGVSAASAVCVYFAN